MNSELEGTWEHMRELGLAALAHANRHAAYYDPENPRWSELSVLQAAHAAEIIIKARIAQEHPLLIFDEFSKLPKDEGTSLTIQNLFEKGKTIQWSDLPTRLWATTGIKIPNQKKFENFGKLRNGIQHFAPIPGKINVSETTLRFVFEVIDPFINECWGLFAVDYDEDYDSYENFPNTLIRMEIPFLVSPKAVKYYEFWKDDLADTDIKYQHNLQEYVNKALYTNSISKKDKAESAYISIDHYQSMLPEIEVIYEQLDRKILSLDAGIRKEYKKDYIAYKVDTNFVDIEPYKDHLKMWLNMPFDAVDDPQEICKDVTNIGHMGNGDAEIKITGETDINYVLGLASQALSYQME